MTHEELLEALSGDFCEDFAGRTARRICDAHAVGLLYDAVTAPLEGYSNAVRHKVLFRGAYVLERIFFEEPERFQPFAVRFCRTDFAACADPSARRHFAKIMAHLLPARTLGLEQLEAVAEAAVQWVLDPHSKVAVRVWAVEVLLCCRARIGWIAASWDDLLETLMQDATPGIACRLRGSWMNPGRKKEGG